MSLKLATGLSILGLLLPGRSALAQCPDGTPPPCRVSRAAPPPTSIAVLYFDNLSRDTDDVYLADGVTEELISRLTQVERLQVKSRTSVRRLRGRPIDDPAGVGRQLGVAHLVSGSVLRDRGRLRVTVELTRVATGNSVWSRSFDRNAGDLIRTESEIAESVAVNVGARLLPAERRRIEARPTRNPQAYDHLLRGKYAIAQRTTASFMRGIRELEIAIGLDSTLTPALIAAGQAWVNVGNLYYSPDVGMSRDSAVARGRALLERASRQDSTSAEALVARAFGLTAEANTPLLERAVRLDPRNVDAHYVLGLAYRAIGRVAEAIEHFRRTVELEPDKIIALQNLGITLFNARRFREAQPWLDSAVAFRPEAPFYYSAKGFGQLALGDTAGARVSANQAAEHGGVPGREEILAMIDAMARDSAAAQRRMVRLDSTLRGRDCEQSHECLELANGLASVGLRSRALDVIERITPVSSWLAYWLDVPQLDGLRGEPRFQRLLQASRAAGDRYIH